MSSHLYTATLVWNFGEFEETAEEIEFNADSTLLGPQAVSIAKKIGEADYRPGFEVLGVIDQDTAEVIWNPKSLQAKTAPFGYISI
jgi:hypothetical protein